MTFACDSLSRLIGLGAAPPPFSVMPLSVHWMVWECRGWYSMHLGGTILVFLFHISQPCHDGRYLMDLPIHVKGPAALPWFQKYQLGHRSRSSPSYRL